MDQKLKALNEAHQVLSKPNLRAQDDAALAGHRLVDLTRSLVPSRRRPDEETLSAVMGGRAHRDTEFSTDGVALIARSIPLRPEGEHIGALVLVRDVTDLRRRDRELITKDATIREIHHRVKNNLQTVAALLRLQARRIEAPEAKAALEEAVHRVGSIAIVHETLSQAVEEDVDFDEIADRLCGMVAEVTAMAGRVRIRRQGSFERLPSETATPLAMVLTEVLQNAVEHGYDADRSLQHRSTEPGDLEGEASGTITVEVARRGDRLEVAVVDDGRGLPDGFTLDGSTNLGLSIVRTLVESELGGRLTLGPADGGGTRAGIDLPVE